MLNDISVNLAKARISADYSQEGLANELGISRQAVSKWERGESVPDLGNLIALAELYGIDLDELIRGKAESTENSHETERSKDSSDEDAEENTVLACEDQESEPSDLEETEGDIEEAETEDFDGSPSRKKRKIALILGGFLGVLVLVALVLCGLYLAQKDDTGSSKEAQSSRHHFLRFNDVPGETHRLSDNPDEIDALIVSPEDVRDLVLTWYGGSVDISVVDDSTTKGLIWIMEYCAETPSSDEKMEFDIVGKTLTVQNSTSSTDKKIPRNVSVRIPRSAVENIDLIEIRGLAKKYNIQGLTCRCLDLFASGQLSTVNMNEVAADQLFIDLLGRGESDITGTFNNLVITQYAGVARVKDLVCPETADISVHDGSLNLTLPEDSSFAIKHTDIGGSYSCAFERNEATAFKNSWPKDNLLERRLIGHPFVHSSPEPSGELLCYGASEPTAVFYARTEGGKLSILK